jgi:hypothetical protein
MIYDSCMRTTLDISDDVLFAAKEVARRERRTIGDVLSTWARAALLQPDQTQRTLTVEEPLARYGIHPLPHRGGVVTNELVSRIRDDEGI